GACGGTKTAQQSVTVSPPSAGGNITPSQTIACSGSNSGTLTLNNSVGTVTWQKSIDQGANWSNTTNTYSNLTQTTLFRASVVSGTCGSVFSDTAVIVVNEPFIPTITASPASAVCSGTPVTLTASGFESLGVLSGGDFSGSNNPGWSGADASNSNGNENSFWGQTTGGKTVNGFKYSSGGTSGGGKFMIVTGNAGGTRPAILSTPIFSLVGMPSAALEYIQGYNLEANAVAKVEISTDGGTSYTTLAQYQGPSTLGPANNFNKKTSIDLKAYLGKTNLKVRFYYLGTYSSTSGSNWAVDDIFIVGPHQALNYSWGSAGSGSSITVIPTTVPTTTYSLSTSYGSCTGTTTTITINVNPLPTQYDVTGGGSYCAGGTGVSVGLSNSQTGVNYQLLNGTTAVGAAKPGNGAALNFGFQTAAGTYTVKATNATTACTQNMTGSATVTINQLPTVSPITGTTSVCVSKTTTLSNATSGGTWSSSNTAAATVNSATGVVTGVAAGSATITYTTAANANGCTNSATASVTVNALPTVAAITGTTSVCVNSTTTLSDATSGGTWSSSNPAVATVNSATGVVTGVAAGSTTITYTTAANANGCTNSATAPVTVNASPTVAAITGTTGVCVNSTTTLSDATASGTWSSSNTSVATVNSTTGLVTGLATGTATITYTVTNAQSCTNSTTAPVTVNPSPAPKITANGPTISCVGSVKLTSDSASGNQWYKDGVAIPLATQQSYTAALPGRYTVVVTNSSGCSGTSPATDISFITSSWTAAAGTTDWNTDANWCSGKVPTDSTNAIIPSNAVLFPQLSNASQVRSLEIQPGAKVSLNGNTLTVNGALTGTGEFVGSPTSGLIVNGTSTSTVNFLQSPDAVSNVLSDLIINTTGTVTLSNKLYITGTLTSTKGTLNTGDHLTIRSTSIANTARVASVSGTISGDVTVERFIPARRAYRFISPSVSTTTSIMDNWMEGGHNSSIDPPPYNPNHGYGTNITGPNPNTNGFDPTITSNPSLFTFNISTQQWDSVPNTKGSLSAGDAYSLMVRGDRSIDMRTNTPTPTNTILRASGKLFTGDYSPTLTNKASKYTFIGNPYASPVDFTKILANANNVGARYWAWDPRVSRRGQYVVYDALNNSNSLPGVSEVDKNIQSGQAFFVQTISGGSASLSFKESYKSTGNTAVFRDPRYTTKLSIQLLLNLNAGLENKADGVVSFFDKDYSSAIGSDDSYKFTNLDENLAINRNGTALSIEGRPTITADDTIPLKIWQFRQSNYYLRLAGSNFSPDVTAFIKDEYLHKQTPVDLSSVTLFPFSIDTSAASFAKDRFSIVFKAGSALPVTLTNVKAYQKNNGIEVDWTSEAETNIAQYEIEKSVNGQDFIKATSINAKGNNSVTENYGWLDEIPNLGSNFYRIKVVEKSGAIKYSNVVRVNIAEVNSSITVFPNPIKDNLVKVQFNNMEKGRYFAVLYNTLGQKLYSSTIDHTTTSGTYTISLGRLISKGTYTLHISKGGITRNERVIVE
uniref:Ig-like domain-containing protein n=1 Tax=Segetibacter koreensis TaxID=398037 RepID=UPI000688E65A